MSGGVVERLRDVHLYLPVPGADVECVKGTYDYYHYGCDGLDDRGWGCGYRTLQTICSWIIHQRRDGSSGTRDGAPNIRNIQDALVKMEDKPNSFRESREWIGSFEISICVDYFYDVPSKLVHVTSGRELADHVGTLLSHFRDFGSPVMMGGDADNASKGIIGVCKEPPSLLVVDPHHFGAVKSRRELHENKMVAWRHIDSFHKDSFYNFCLPQLKYKTGT